MLLFKGHILVTACLDAEMPGSLLGVPVFGIVEGVASKEAVTLGELVIGLDHEIILIRRLDIGVKVLGRPVSQVRSIGDGVKIEIRLNCWVNHCGAQPLRSLCKTRVALKSAPDPVGFGNHA